MCQVTVVIQFNVQRSTRTSERFKLSFCHDYTTQAIIQRSSLSLDDISPVNPIVKYASQMYPKFLHSQLIDELIFECHGRVPGARMHADIPEAAYIERLSVSRGDSVP